MSGAVSPADLPGVWERELIERPDGSRDETTRVYWLQGRALFADIRLPAGDPVSTPEGFAGRTVLTPAPAALRCEWRREIDWSPGGPADIGLLSWTAPGPDGAPRMREDGAEAPYYEIWRKTASPGPGDAVWSLTTETGQAIAARFGARQLIAAATPTGAGLSLSIAGETAPNDQLIASEAAAEAVTAVAAAIRGAASAWRIAEHEAF